MVKLSIKTKIRSGFISVFAIMLLVAIYLFVQLQIISKQTRLLYEHPFRVSNAIQDIKTEFYKNSSLVKDIQLAGNHHQIDSLETETNNSDNIIQKDFKVVSLKYLGNKATVDSAYAAFTAWKIKRDNFYRLKTVNKTDSSQALLIFDSRANLERINYFLTIISDFADNKAESTIKKVIETENNSEFTSIILFLVSGLLILFLIRYLTRSIERPIKAFVSEANILLKKVEQTKIVADEQIMRLTLAELKKAYQSIEKQDCEINLKNKELSGMNLVLEEKVKQRTAELVNANNELLVQNEEKEKRAQELIIANKELLFQNEEKEKLDADLNIANEERREKNEYLENLINYANAPIIVWNTKYEITRFNRAFETITGRSENEVLGKSLEILFPPAEKEFSMEIIRQTETGTRLEIVEINIVHIDGSVRILQWNSANIMSPDGKTTVSTIAQGHDITIRKRVVEEIKKLNETLEQNITERTVQLVESNRELEAFSYSVSHDLRAPLRHIGGFIDLLRKGNSAQLNETGIRYLNIISESSNEMGKLIDALLTFSRLGRASLQKTEFNCRELVNRVLKSFDDELKGRKVEINLSALPDSKGDEILINQVWVNLISNALKYTRNREIAVINIGGIIENGETIFHIKDNGVGFDMNYAGKLFGVFQRLHKAADFEGVGIGLANVNRIIMKHGGKCWAESEVDKGATFFFSLPTNQ